MITVAIYVERLEKLVEDLLVEGAHEGQTLRLWHTVDRPRQEPERKGSSTNV